MYKKKIRFWGIEKRNKPEEMNEMLRAIALRKAQGLPPIQRRIRGKIITEEEVKRYFNRKRAKKVEHSVGTNKGGSSSTGKTKSTSESSERSSSTLVKLEPTETEHIGHGWIGNHMHKYPDINMSRPPQMSLPDLYRIPDEFFRYIYMHQSQVLRPLILPQAAFDGTMSLDDEVFRAIKARRRSIDSRAMDSLWNLLEAGVKLMNEDKLQLGFASLERAFREIRSALLSPSPGKLTSLPMIILITIELKQPAVGELFARHVFEQALSLYGPNHVLTRWCWLLFQRWNSVDLLQWGVQANCDATSATFGRYDSWSLALQYSAMESRVGMANLSFGEINQKFDDLLLDCSNSRLVNIRVTIQCQRMYAQHLARNSLFARAEEILQKVPQQALQDWPDERDIEAGLFALDDLVEYVALQGELERADLLLKSGLKRARERFGDDSPVAIHFLRAAAKFCRNHGRPSEADDYYEQLSVLLEPFHLSSKDT